MKRLITTLLMLTMAFPFAIAQQPYVVLSGHVLNQMSGEPVVGQVMYISVDSMNSPGYYNQVLTDEAGFYTDQIPTYPGVSQDIIIVNTADCNGMMASGTAAFYPGIEEVTIDFNICGDPAWNCSALFRVEPASNDYLSFSFIDESFPMAGGTIDNWIWDFGDGTISNEQNPSHTYAEPGVYNACLMISSNDSTCNSTYCMPVEAGSTNPGGCENYFWYWPDSTGAGLTFEGWVINGEVSSWQWDFGDGTTANGQTVAHQFADTNRVHNVCLTTTSILNGVVCTAVSCQEVFIYIPAPCESSFSYYPDSTGTGYTFEGWAMNNQVDSWTWEFGDGTTASGQSVSHTFTNPNDIYTVCLTTTGIGPDGESCTYTSCQEVFIYLPSPCESYFWYYSDSTNTDYTFEGYTMNDQVDSWTWDFGDGTTESGQLVSHVFADPNTTYAVCLTTTGTGPDGQPCTYTSCQEVYIYIPSPCESYFWYYPDSTATTGFTFEGWSMNGTSNNQIESWVWDFGDGTFATGQIVSHIFSDPAQIYTVCLTTTGTGPDGVSCSYVSCQEVFIYIPSPCENYFTATTNDGNNYTFEGYLNSGAPAEFFWDFGDGSTGSGQQVMHMFQAGTLFNVCLTTIGLNPSDSCVSTSCQPIFPGGGGSWCEAVMSALPDSSGYTYYFEDLSQGDHSIRYWDFGDGEMSTEASVAHTYTNPGIYWACLTIGDSLNMCLDQTCEEIWVDLIQPDCQASFFAYPSDSTTSALSYQFINTSTPGFTSQQWTFGDGTASMETNPVHTYIAPGIYTVCLTIWGTNSTCQSTYCMEIYAGEYTVDFTISGLVEAGNTLANQGIVWLIGADNTYNGETTINPDGTYNFGGVPAGSYYIYAMLTPGSPEFFDYLPTYYTSSLTWQGATIVTTGEPNGWYPVSLVSSTACNQGNGNISGTINWSGTFKSGGTPAANVEIVLFNSNGLPIAYTFSNTDGTFAFSNLPYGEYTIHAEMTGKTTQAAIVVLSDGSAIASINFIVTETAINTLGNHNIDSPKLQAGDPYPNPVNDLLYLQLNSAVSGTVIADVVDLQGRVLTNERINLSGGNNRISISTSNLTKGIYLIRISSEGYQPLQRKFIK